MASALVAIAMLLSVQAKGASAAGLIAPASSCKSVSGYGSQSAARKSMLCFANYARFQTGLKAFKAHPRLNHSSIKKAQDIIRCNQFSHEACGREFQYWIERSGYSGCSIGENIAWGSGYLGTSRNIFIAWMKSPGHRSAIFNRGYRHIGISVKAGRMSGYSGARVWVQNFGDPC